MKIGSWFDSGPGHQYLVFYNPIKFTKPSFSTQLRFEKTVPTRNIPTSLRPGEDRTSSGRNTDDTFLSKAEVQLERSSQYPALTGELPASEV